MMVFPIMIRYVTTGQPRRDDLPLPGGNEVIQRSLVEIIRLEHPETVFLEELFDILPPVIPDIGDDSQPVQHPLNTQNGLGGKGGGFRITVCGRGQNALRVQEPVSLAANGVGIFDDMQQIVEVVDN